MDDDTFEKLKADARFVEEGIEELQKIYDSPHSLLCHRGENIEQAKTALNDLMAPIVEMKNEMMIENELRADYSKEMYRFLSECNIACNTLKEDFDNIETLFSEYGYVKFKDAVHHSDDSIGANNIEQMESLSINTPLNERSHNVSQYSSFALNNINDNAPKYIATPVIKSVASVMQAESSKHNIMTPK